MPDAQLRATLVGSQLLGLAVMRYVGRIEPLASASIDELVAAIGPTVQRYLTEDLGPGDAVDRGVDARAGQMKRERSADAACSSSSAPGCS